jgi:hypothetical protein
MAKLLWSTLGVMRKETLPNSQRMYIFPKSKLDSILKALPKTFTVSRTTPNHYEILHKYNILSFGIDVEGNDAKVTL